MSQKTGASSAATWALLAEGVSAAALEAHRLRHLYNRGRAMVDRSEEKEHLYQVAGDVILGVEQRLDVLDRVLDRTSYALSKLGEDHLRDRLPITDRRMVEDAVEGARSFDSSPRLRQSASRVAAAWLASQEE